MECLTSLPEGGVSDVLAVGWSVWHLCPEVKCLTSVPWGGVPDVLAVTWRVWHGVECLTSLSWGGVSDVTVVGWSVLCRCCAVEWILQIQSPRCGRLVLSRSFTDLLRMWWVFIYKGGLFVLSDLCRGYLVGDVQCCQLVAISIYYIFYRWPKQRWWKLYYDVILFHSLTPFLPSFPSLPHSQYMSNLSGYIVSMKNTDYNYFANVVVYHWMTFLCV